MRSLASTLWAIAAYGVYSSTGKFISERSLLLHQHVMAPDIPPGYEEAHGSETKNWVKNVSTDPFYETPNDWERHAPGSVLRIERTDLREYTVIPQDIGLSMYRLLYQSLDHNDKPVPASAFILIPYSRVSPSTPLRVIVWAHGTAGIERQCAPSNQRDLYYNWGGPLAMVLRGYVVIAPDYAGLGSDATFYYGASPNHASDIAYAVVATRTAFPPDIISQEWVAVGHSEGGAASWAVNEREFEKPTGGFLGTVSLAPASRKLHNLRYGLEHGSVRGSLFYYSYNLIGMARMIKSFDLTKYFSNLGIERARLAATGCYTTAEALYADLTFSDIFLNSSWLNATDWENKTGVTGDKPLAAPLLLIQGLADQAINHPVTSEIFQQLCSLHPSSRAHLSLYPNLDHDPIMYSSQREFFTWIESRFNGVQISPGCTNSTVDTTLLRSTRISPLGFCRLEKVTGWFKNVLSIYDRFVF